MKESIFIFNLVIQIVIQVNLMQYKGKTLSLDFGTINSLCIEEYSTVMSEIMRTKIGNIYIYILNLFMTLSGTRSL